MKTEHKRDSRGKRALNLSSSSHMGSSLKSKKTKMSNEDIIALTASPVKQNAGSNSNVKNLNYGMDYVPAPKTNRSFKTEIEVTGMDANGKNL